jgi:hypothetical protein
MTTEFQNFTDSIGLVPRFESRGLKFSQLVNPIFSRASHLDADADPTPPADAHGVLKPLPDFCPIHPVRFFPSSAMRNRTD